MILYSGLMFFVLWFGGLSRIRNKKVYLIIIGMILSFTAGFRYYTVGVDTEQYYFSYIFISNLSWGEITNTRYELGYAIMVKLLSIISAEPQFLFIVTSIFIHWIVMWFIYKYSPHYWLSAYLYLSMGYFYNSMNLLRQSFAMCIVLLGVPFLLKKKIVPFILITLLASQFHSSAIIALLLLTGLVIKDQKIILYGGIFFGAFGFLFGSKLFEMFSSLNQRYTGYSAVNFAFANYFATAINAAVALVILLCYLYSKGFVFHSIKDYVFANKKIMIEGIFLSAAIAFLVLELIAIRANIFERLTAYFAIFSIIIIPSSLNIIKDEVHKKVLFLFIIACTYLQNIIILYYRPNWSGVVPYRFFNW